MQGYESTGRGELVIVRHEMNVASRVVDTP